MTPRFMIDCKSLSQRFTSPTLTMFGGQPIDMDTTVFPGKAFPSFRHRGIMVRTWFKAAKKDLKSDPTITGNNIVCFATPEYFPQIIDAIHVPWLFCSVTSAKSVSDGNSDGGSRAVELRFSVYVLQCHTRNKMRDTYNFQW